MNIQELKTYANNMVKSNPTLKDEIYEIVYIAISEAEEGGFEASECDLAKHEIELIVTEQTFEYILDSRMNGNHRQARELFNNLSSAERKSFFSWYEELFYNSESEEYNELKTYLHKKL